MGTSTNVCIFSFLSNQSPFLESSLQCSVAACDYESISMTKIDRTK